MKDDEDADTFTRQGPNKAQQRDLVPYVEAGSRLIQKKIAVMPLFPVCPQLDQYAREVGPVPLSSGER